MGGNDATEIWEVEESDQPEHPHGDEGRPSAETGCGNCHEKSRESETEGEEEKELIFYRDYFGVICVKNGEFQLHGLPVLLYPFGAMEM